MLFHYALYNGLTLTTQHTLQRIGFYGVSVFYLLSGLTLYHIYQRQPFIQTHTVKAFFRKRIARIYPLFVSITVLFFLYRQESDIKTLLLNISGLFSIFSWSDYLITGAWSIGNELFFYLIFPIILILFQKRKLLFIPLLLISLLCYIWFAFFLIDTGLDTKTNWHYYTNPLNQAFLFVLGMGIGIAFQNRPFKKLFLWFACLTALSVFVFYPVENDNVFALVYGKERLLFTVLCAVLVFSVFKSEIRLPKYAHLILFTAGEISYGIYLLHPVVFSLVKTVLPQQPLYLITAVSILLTVIAAYLSYRYFERYFIRLGKGGKAAHQAT